MDVTGQSRVKNAGGTRTGTVGSPGGGVRLSGFFVCVCFWSRWRRPQTAADFKWQKIAHKSEWRRIENKSRETALDREGQQVGRGDG